MSNDDGECGIVHVNGRKGDVLAAVKRDFAEPPRRDPRQQEIKEWFLENYYGRAPVGRPSDMEFKGDEIWIGGGKVKIRLSVALPPEASQEKPCPVIVVADGRSTRATPIPHDVLKRILSDQDEFRRMALERGCALVMWNVNDVAPDCWLYDRYIKMKPGELPPNAWGVFGLYGGEPDGRKGDTWGTIRAWAWGMSRVMDWIESRPEMDAKRVAVCGHSRLGKTALVAGVTDERFLVAYSNDSGVGGAHPHRFWKPGVCKLSYVNEYHRHWLCLNSRKFEADEKNIPHDMDEFLALMAPRYLYVASASKDAWAGPEGEQLSAKIASLAWDRMGLRGWGDKGHVGGHVRDGAHAFKPYDFRKFLDFCEGRLFGKWKEDDKGYAAGERIIFNWHNFLSSCSTWDAGDWRGWIDRAKSDGYNAIMVHAYGNNPMASFSFNGKEREVGRLTTSADGRDWSTMHVNDVRRLVGGEAFDAPVFGSKAALVPEGERTAATKALMREAFERAASNKMGVYFAVDLDTAPGNPQELITTLPESARFKTGKRGRWLANPDTPEGYAYYKAAVDSWMDAYPQITTLVLWVRLNDTVWVEIKENEFPAAWRREYAKFLAEHPAAAKEPRMPGLFAYSKVVRAAARALEERGSKAKTAVGSWCFKFMPSFDMLLPEGTALIYLDYNSLYGKPELTDVKVAAKTAEISARRPVIPVIWAHHDDGRFIGRAYTPYDNLREILAESKAAGFGVIHWMTRPLDLFLYASVRGVMPGAKSESLAETCKAFAAEKLNEPELGGYLYDWAFLGPIFGRETEDFFVDREIGRYAMYIVDGCYRRLRMLEGQKGPNAEYFRGLENFCIAFYNAQAKYEEAAAALKRGKTGAARKAIAAAKPEEAVRLYASLASLVYFHQMRQSLGMEPVRVKFGETKHEPLAQLPGKYTYYIDGEGRMWRTFGTSETGAERVFAAPLVPEEIGQGGVASRKSFNVGVGPIGKTRKHVGLLLPGKYVLRVLVCNPGAARENERVFKVSAGGAGVLVDAFKAAGGPNRLGEVEIPVQMKKAGKLNVAFEPVKGEIAVSGLVLAPAPQSAAAQARHRPVRESGGERP